MSEVQPHRHESNERLQTARQKVAIENESGTNRTLKRRGRKGVHPPVMAKTGDPGQIEPVVDGASTVLKEPCGKNESSNSKTKPLYSKRRKRKTRVGILESSSFNKGEESESIDHSSPCKNRSDIDSSTMTSLLSNRNGRLTETSENQFQGSNSENSGLLADCQASLRLPPVIDQGSKDNDNVLPLIDSDIKSSASKQNFSSDNNAKNGKDNSPQRQVEGKLKNHRRNRVKNSSRMNPNIPGNTPDVHQSEGCQSKLSLSFTTYLESNVIDGSSASNSGSTIEPSKITSTQSRPDKEVIEKNKNKLKQKKAQNVDFPTDPKGKNPSAIISELKDISTQRATDIIQVDHSNKKKKSYRQRQKKWKSRPWLSAIPPGTVDPISLEPLEDLNYPPFALMMDEPYTAMFPGMWPPSKNENDTTYSSNSIAKNDNLNSQIERETLILQNQWGKDIIDSKIVDRVTRNQLLNDSRNALIKAMNTGNEKTTTNTASSIQGRQFYLFDGQVLAGYLIRTLQFINPFNRRDLTRPELAALDAYISTYKLSNIGVVQAYDEKGVTLSMAGIAGQTPSGRAEILQQEARAIQNSFFRGSTGGVSTSDLAPSSSQSRATRHPGRSRLRSGVNEPTNTFQRMYRDHIGRDNGHTERATPSYHEQESTDNGIYVGDNGGFILIDDDINPGLRSEVPTTNSTQALNPSHQNSEQDIIETNFPLLDIASDPHNTVQTSSIGFKNTQSSISQTLKSITKVVKKTDSAEIERQKKAREEAQRKAMMAGMTCFDPSIAQQSGNTHNGPLTATIAATKMVPTEAVLERNRNLASALGVVPAVMKSEQSLTGWARPVTVDTSLDQFGKELNFIQYPDSLLTKARDLITELLKLEKSWKKFLADDRAPSFSLKPMDRSTRMFVHEYSDFWRLKTQSYDPEGKRYIHCIKLPDTSAPHPLLSEASKTWRGPISGPSTHVNSDPLISFPKPAPSRFTDLKAKERPPLLLMPRTIPLPEESQKKVIQLEQSLKKESDKIRRREYKTMRAQEKERRKNALIEQAFASDDDEDYQSCDSDWFYSDAEFQGSDDEGL